MAGKSKNISAFVLMLLVPLILGGCANDLAELKISGDTYVYTPSAFADLEKQAAAVSEETPEVHEAVLTPETSTAPENAISTEQNENTVYWVESGKVWHTTENCKSLSRSKNIKSGTPDDAVAAGKERACSVCGS